MKKWNETNLRNLVKRGRFTSELEYERGELAGRQMKLLAEADSSKAELAAKLIDMCHQYEKDHWRNFEMITDSQIEESDYAEAQAQYEHQFIQRRKDIVLTKLKAIGLGQEHLGLILNHTKSYTSDLLLGLRPFSLIDLILIHHLLGIPLKDLLLTSIPYETQKYLRETIAKPAYRKVGFKGEKLAFVPLPD